jgi:hypothetical protein
MVTVLYKKNYFYFKERLAQALSNHDVIVLRSGGIFKFLFNNLQQINSSLSSMPLKEIRNGLLKSRNKIH